MSRSSAAATRVRQAETAPSTDPASDPDLAAALRRLRKQTGLTQADLAYEAGVSTSFISQLERSSTDVTFSTLNRICMALGTTVGHLLSPPQPCGTILRKDSCRFLDYNGVDKWVLTRESMGDVDVCLFEFPPGSSTGLRTVTAMERTELWICQSGYLGAELGGAVHILRPGDSLDFASGQPNTIYNPGPERCQALLVIKNHDMGRAAPRAPRGPANRHGDTRREP
ncbi:helix-turn-helix domain-containing protein [Brevibacterium album]|uniref:helix-turn-helix domain-containing protein n=1 Tax=Brevibacterium album TaxID=417948 RepID=UPI00054D1A5A|nr:helix-turn-helix domain-containing protein [Brevibacterium album]